MSEKRFKLNDKGSFILEDGEPLKPLGNVVHKLNDLHEERNYFEKKKCEYWNKFNLAHLDNINLQEENDILKQKLRKNYIANKQYEELKRLQEENERLRNQLERKTILLKIRTKYIDDREKSFHELLNYLESFCYKSNIDGNYAKQDIINILNNWEIREYD